MSVFHISDSAGMGRARPVRYPRVAGTRESGLTLMEVVVAITISGLLALAVLFASRIGFSAWGKAQRSIVETRRVTNVADLIEIQLSNLTPRAAELATPDRTVVPFFFGMETRLLFASSYSVANQGRGGLVAADYECERQEDGTWSLLLDEHPYLDDRWLGKRIAGVARDVRGDAYVVLSPFHRDDAALLWKGLRACSFQYRREGFPQAVWLAGWPFGAQQAPSAIALRVEGAPGQRTIQPVSLVVALPARAVVR